jgi:hypothetical protein
MHPRHSRRGVALLMSLLVLGLLASLAVVSLQATSLELQMTGNEQYRLRALAAAEAGVTLATNAVLRAVPAPAVPPDLPRTAMPEMPGDFYRTEIRYLGIDLSVRDRSGGAQQGHHYALHGWGSSARGASVELESGLLVIRDAGGALLSTQRSYWRRRDVE